MNRKLIINVFPIISFCIYAYLTTLSYSTRNHPGNPSKSKPNILLILMDDLSISDVGYYGSDIPTPNIDSLANNGIRLNYHYSQPTCSATRSALLTGRYSWRTGLSQVISLPSKQGINPDIPLISDILSDNGYDTLLSGKWHIGYSNDNQLPLSRGFKQALYFTDSHVNYTAHNYHFDWTLAMSPGIIDQEIENMASLYYQLNNRFPQGWLVYDLWENQHTSMIDKDCNQYVEDMMYLRVKKYLKGCVRYENN